MGFGLGNNVNPPGNTGKLPDQYAAIADATSVVLDIQKKKVQVERATRDARPARDVLRPRALIAVLCKELARSLEQALARLLAPSRSRSATGAARIRI